MNTDRPERHARTANSCSAMNLSPPPPSFGTPAPSSTSSRTRCTSRAAWSAKMDTLRSTIRYSPPPRSTCSSLTNSARMHAPAPRGALLRTLRSEHQRSYDLRKSLSSGATKDAARTVRTGATSIGEMGLATIVALLAPATIDRMGVVTALLRASSSSSNADMLPAPPLTPTVPSPSCQARIAPH